MTLIYVSVLEREHAIESSLEEAKSTVTIATTFQTLLIKRTENFLKNLSTFAEVQQPNSAQCSAFLADLIKIKDIYNNIGIPNIDGTLLCSAKPLSKPVNVADRPYIQRAINQRAFSIGEFQVDRVTGVSSLNFAYPVVSQENQALVGIAVAVLSLDWWSEQFSTLALPKYSVTYVTDHRQRIIATFPTNSSILGSHIADIEGQLRPYDSDAEHAISSYLSSGQNAKIFFQKPLINDSQLVMISVGIPFEEKLNAINSNLLKIGLLVSAFVVLMFFVALWGIKISVLVPLKALIQSTKELEEGKFKGELPLHGSTELVDLQQRFTLMAKARVSAQSQLESSQQHLQESKNLLSAHIDNTPLGCVSWDKDSICTKWNKSAENIFGYRAEEAIGKHASDLVLLPELKGEYKKFFRSFIRQKGGRSSTSKNKTKSGKVIICVWHNTLIRSQDGQVLGVSSFVQDITQNKLAEEQLTLAASVFTHAKEGIFITDSKGAIIEVNDTFVAVTGYQRDEVLGKNPNLLKSNKQTPEFYQKLWRTIEEEGHWTGEIWNKRKNQELYAQLLTINSVLDNAGNVKNYVAIFTDQSEIKEQQLKLEHMAHYDVLTNLPNRSLLTEHLNKEILRCKQNAKELAVVFLDLDGFKEINDLYGHSFGDQILIVLATRLQNTLGENDILSRIGGDEFVAVLTNLAHTEDFRLAVEKMLKVTSDPIALGDDILKISTSIGVTIYPTNNTNADQLIRHADQAMYVAKQKGKNCYHLFDFESEDAIKLRNEVLHNISCAIELNEFVLYYQPKVNMRTGQIIGVEALIRWQHPSRGLLPPFEFLPFVENHHLSVEIGEWVIEEALTQLARWKKAGLDLPISVNIGALQIQQANFTNRLEKLLRAYPEIDPQNLQIEILETSEIGDVNNVSQTINNCLKLGVSFAIDDFGTGYSSLTYLRRLPVDLIKIDQTFIRDMLVDAEDKAIVMGIIGLANSFDRKVIAEGVETIAHGTALLKLGCETAQGYGIAKPMPADQLPEWAKNWTTDQAWQIS
ncbi:EAL domain-containing protein [Paraglaciecola aquimarina]|uniref:EAL domain-containing protein n=1 Tax=Paraglaciecola aquimarina TaxID=1235557 RepID=A0ABU3SX84_9ALTE|nr:EAL domain-containing protein [Paraglaciecola aquimarina]MDU0354628.1 EAL domain-containing protein [Paraglaciecola aquimarina]